MCYCGLSTLVSGEDGPNSRNTQFNFHICSLTTSSQGIQAITHTHTDTHTLTHSLTHSLTHTERERERERDTETHARGHTPTYPHTLTRHLVCCAACLEQQLQSAFALVATAAKPAALGCDPEHHSRLPLAPPRPTNHQQAHHPLRRRRQLGRQQLRRTRMNEWRRSSR